MVTSESLVKLVKMIAVSIWSGNSALSSVFGYKKPDWSHSGVLHML